MMWYFDYRLHSLLGIDGRAQLYKALQIVSLSIELYKTLQIIISIYNYNTLQIERFVDRELPTELYKTL